MTFNLGRVRVLHELQQPVAHHRQMEAFPDIWLWRCAQQGHATKKQYCCLLDSMISHSTMSQIMTTEEDCPLGWDDTH